MSRLKILIIALLLVAGPVRAQDATDQAANPLAELKEEVKHVLEQAGLPFTEQQENAIVLMMEDRRKASEDLFGDLMDFSSGPTQGEQADRIRSAIQWVRNEFLGRLQDYLTPEQAAAWRRHLEAATAPANTTVAESTPRQQSQTQYVRINNNAFTGEENSYRYYNRSGEKSSLVGTEVIQRGGAGSFHGNAEFLLKDARLNAGRRFASNKPPYQERQTSFDISGPAIPGRLTTYFAFTQNEAENVDTIHATLPAGVFALGITKPTIHRSLTVHNTLQLGDHHTVSLNAGYHPNSKKNQGIGGFVLPERAYDATMKTWNFEVRDFLSLSSTSIVESRFNISGTHDRTTPISEALQVNVLDSFNSGGAQNASESTNRIYEISNLYTRLGENLTLKTGYYGVYRKNHSFNRTNFGGAFTFSSLDAYRQQQPLNYRVVRGNPILDSTQFEIAIFEQNDFKLTPRLTLMTGVRYELQTNVHDRNNIDPRLGLAYAPGRATVIRVGAGVFHQRFLLKNIEYLRRGDGTHQYEIILDRPSFPDPFQSGSARNASIRVKDDDLVTPYSLITLVSVERTFLGNLFLSVAYDRSREVHRPRLRNINAPLDITSAEPASCGVGQSKDTCVRPYPERGNILNLESTAKEYADVLRINYRQRFSIFNVAASYTISNVWLDGNLGNALGQQNVPAGLGPDGLNSDNYNLRADWAHILSASHVVNTTLNASLPFGIFLTETTAVRARGRYTLTTGKDDNQDTAVNDRPAGIARNAQIAPASITFNFNVSKAFFFGAAPSERGAARKNLNLFANMTNAFNRPNYASPSGVMTSPNFGRSTSAGDPREIEIGLRVQF